MVRTREFALLTAADPSIWDGDSLLLTVLRIIG